MLHDKITQKQRSWFFIGLKGHYYYSHSHPKNKVSNLMYDDKLSI